jgi:phosphoribosyl-ATP pyrophosphohydrolase/phosphoribosyl-AMP cyclohydrolase
VTFFSRSKQRLWTKGESSGHTLELVAVDADCDRDTLLVTARPQGPTCHLGTASCFADAPANFLADLDALIAQRYVHRPTGSYTSELFAAVDLRIPHKIKKKSVETALAAATQDSAALLGEAADLVYHLAVLLRARGLSLAAAITTLQARHG